jgi:hypothetical protein
VVKAELFPTHIRALGVGLPYAVSVSMFGGTAESIALGSSRSATRRWFYYYLTAVIAVSLLVYVGMRDTKKHSTIGAIRRQQEKGADQRHVLVCPHARSRTGPDRGASRPPSGGLEWIHQ